MGDELKMCPFCGGQRITVWNISDGQQAVCKDCKATGSPVYNGQYSPEECHEKAREAWNRRAVSNAALMKEVREVTAEALQWMEHVWERDNAGQCCSPPMAIHDLRALLAKLGGE